jgi:hypothetical protein
MMSGINCRFSSRQFSSVKFIFSFTLLAAFLFLSHVSFAQQRIPGTTLTGEKGITRTVDEIMAQEHVVPFTHYRLQREHEAHLHKVNNPDAPAVSSYPPYPQEQKRGGGGEEVQATQTIGTSWRGVTLATSGGWLPPDCNGATGPTQVLTCANTRIQVYDKTGVLGPLNADLNTFFSSVRNGSGISDTHIRYDRLSQRWFVVTINVASSDNRVCIAVSSGPIITSSASFTFFYFTESAVANEFFDYPTLGVDKNALYIGGNRFAPGFTGSMVFVVQKSSVLGVGPIVFTPFRGVATGSSGIYTPQGVDNDDPTATEGYFVGSDAAAWSKLDFIRVNNPGSVAPTVTILTQLTVPTTIGPITQVSSGTANRLDGLDDRPYAAHIMKNKLTGVSTLWTAQNIQVNTAGVASGTGGRNGSRWYQVGNMTTTPTLVQAGTEYDAAASNMRGYWIPSIAMSGQGHSVLAGSTASAVNFADVQVAGRYSCDPLGTLQPSVLATNSATVYAAQGGTQRWGDYSQVVVDPNDNMTMWAFAEYCDAANDWAVRVVKLNAPAPPPTASLVPLATVGHSASLNVFIIASSTPGCTGFFDPGGDVSGPGFANHLTAAVTGGIIVNSAAFVDATHVTLNLNTLPAASGTYTITITNPDGQTTTIPINIDSALPVELLSFDAKATNSNCILHWETASEINNDYFIIQRSVDGNTFEDIGKVKGAGNSTSIIDYTYIDKNPVCSTCYYRLNQVDFDGKSSLSKIIRVNFESSEFALSGTVVDYENNSIKIYLNSNRDENVVYRICDLPGRIISLGSKTTGKGINTIEIDTKYFSHGIYFLSLSNEEKILSEKIFY